MNAVFAIAGAALAGLFFFKGRDALAGEESSPADDTDGGAMTDWTRFDSLFKKYGEISGVPWEWLKAVALNESDLGRNSRVARGDVSSDGKSWGLMQLTLATAGDYKPGVTIADLNDPETSVDLASQYLGYLFRRFAGDAQKVIMSYNQGQGNTDAGKTYALGYFQKWQSNLDKVKETL